MSSTLYAYTACILCIVARSLANKMSRQQWSHSDMVKLKPSTSDITTSLTSTVHTPPTSSPSRYMLCCLPIYKCTHCTFTLYYLQSAEPTFLCFIHVYVYVHQSPVLSTTQINFPTQGLTSTRHSEASPCSP